MQLEAIKKERGVSVEDGTVARDKTLAAVLAENKAKKEEEFANVWKTMKQGRQVSLCESMQINFVKSQPLAHCCLSQGKTGHWTRMTWLLWTA